MQVLKRRSYDDGMYSFPTGEGAGETSGETPILCSMITWLNAFPAGNAMAVATPATTIKAKANTFPILPIIDGL